ncbi:hypothetical protein [Cellulomonas sp. PhB143]|uniref:hypothetical protein n=1 Tax=Cellulomonas sp. PhB143 TaxID=2485186 RepID=UPI000F4ACFFC|nr:hypothetical protein [Cellulomonas sp. PhB143]ROS76736.1 hypothetical protein EDF32_1557 [Cellulomonas sp. PhB143]
MTAGHEVGGARGPGRIAGSTLRLPEDWYGVPADDVPGWAAELAGLLVASDDDGPAGVAADGAPDGGPDGARDPSDRSAPADVVRAALVDELCAVGSSLAGLGDPAARAAVWVPRPGSGGAAAMLVLAPVQDAALAGAQAYEDELVARLTADPRVLARSLRAVEGDTPAGAVRGVHAVVEVAREDGSPDAVLEERAVLGVLAPGCSDVLEATVLSSSLVEFDDLPAQALAVLDGLSLVVEDRR